MEQKLFVSELLLEPLLYLFSDSEGPTSLDSSVVESFRTVWGLLLFRRTLSSISWLRVANMLEPLRLELDSDISDPMNLIKGEPVRIEPKLNFVYVSPG